METLHSLSTSERKERASISPQIATGRIGTLAAVAVALSTFLPGGKVESKRTATEPVARVSTITGFVPPASLLAQMKAAAHSGGTLENVQIIDGVLTCTLEGERMSGTVNAQNELETVRVRGYDITLTHPVSQKILERYLRNALYTTQYIDDHFDYTVQDNALNSYGGGRFFFTARDASGPPTDYAATVRDILRIDTDAETVRQFAEAHLEELSQQLAKTRSSLQVDLQKQKDTLLTRHSAVLSSIDKTNSSIMSFHRRQEFNNGWQRFADSMKKTLKTEHAPLFREAHAYLNEWEASMHIVQVASFQTEYQTLLDEQKKLREQYKHVHNQVHTRTYFNDMTGETVVEVDGTSPKNFTRTFRMGETLSEKHTYEDDYLRQRIHYDEEGNYHNEDWYRHFSGGTFHRHTQWIHEHEDDPWQLLERTDNWLNGHTRLTIDNATGTMRYYEEDGDLVYGEDHRTDNERKTRYMVDRNGKHFGNYNDEKVKNPDLTPSQYLDILAKKLDSPVRFAVFFEQFFEYEYDADTDGNGIRDDDYWQTAEETVKRIDAQSGKMEGDCDDWAFFGRAVLRRQGEHAHVLIIPSHAICVWVTVTGKGENTRYHAHSVGTFGYDDNGNHFNTPEPDTGKHAGYKTVLEALNALMKKYKYPGLGLAEGQDYELEEGSIRIAPSAGLWTGWTDTVSSGFFLEEV